MSKAVPAGHSAVMAQKRKRVSDGEPWQDFELFPTPPWATRALIEVVLPQLGASTNLGVVREPAAGLGHMSSVLADYAAEVLATDIFNYPLATGGTTEQFGIERVDFCDRMIPLRQCDWVITNPPFGKAEDFLQRVLSLANRGVALFLRMQWLETIGRYDRIFADKAPTLVAQFAERVAMCEGGYDPQGSTATAYAWFIFKRGADGQWQRPHLSQTSLKNPAGWLDFYLIRPGQKERLFKRSDYQLAARTVPGFVPPSTLQKTGRNQIRMEGL